jgi:hypothetical protein
VGLLRDLAGEAAAQEVQVQAVMARMASFLGEAAEAAALHAMAMIQAKAATVLMASFAFGAGDNDLRSA